MISHWISLLILECTAFFASASLFRGRQHGRGTVMERRAFLSQAPSGTPTPPDSSDVWGHHQNLMRALDKAAPERTTPTDMFGVQGHGVEGRGIDRYAPEDPRYLQDYQVGMPTPVPAPLSGVYCRGGACQYRVVPPPPTYPPPVTPPPIPVGGSFLSTREFCRGLSCIGGMGLPDDPALGKFTMNCVHLFNDVAGGMSGQDTDRNIAQVHESFASACKRRVDILEADRCPRYANAFVAANAAKVNQPTVGGTVEVCRDTYVWLQMFKQAEIDLKLVPAALPKGTSLLAIDLNRLGTGGVGPSSPRGLRWREHAWRHHQQWPPPAVPQQLAADGSLVGSLLQFTSNATETAVVAPLLPGADADQDTPRGMPKYVPAPLPNLPPDVKAQPQVPQSQTKYQIAPGSPDGVVPPVEVAGEAFDYCNKQFSEIMMGFSQTATVIVHQTKGWCGWQSGVGTWNDQHEEIGHPDWTHRTCSGMANLVAFALADELSDTTGGLSSQQVCKKIFLATGAAHRADSLVKGAWETNLRGPPTSGIPAADDAEMKQLLKDAQDIANSIFSKLRAQKASYQEMQHVRRHMADFDYNNIELPSPPPIAGMLPDSANFPGPRVSDLTASLNPSSMPAPSYTPATVADMNAKPRPVASAPFEMQHPWERIDPPPSDVDHTALLALSVERVRQSQRLSITKVNNLTSWGHAD